MNDTTNSLTKRNVRSFMLSPRIVACVALWLIPLVINPTRLTRFGH